MENFGIVFTVKNEWSILKYVIPYYLKQGAKKIFIFLDNCTDETQTKLKNRKNIEVYQSLEGCKLLKNRPSYLEFLENKQINERVDFRKRINAFIALNKAKEYNIEWLAVIDPDELIIKNKSSPNIKSLLNSIPKEVDQILMENLELFPKKSNFKNPFKKQIYFKKRIKYVDQLINKIFILLKIFIPSKVVDRAEYYIFKYLLNYFFINAPINPYNGNKIYRGIFTGYKGVKSFMRTKNALNYNFNIHKWIYYKKQPKNMYKGLILHYDLINSNHFLSKFKKRHVADIKGFKSFHYQRLQLAQAASTLNKREADSFFEKYFMWQEKYKKSKHILNLEIVTEEISRTRPLN